MENEIQVLTCLSSFDLEKVPDNLQLELTDLQNERDQKQKINSVRAANDTKYNDYNNCDKKLLSIFASINRCEQTFSLTKRNKSELLVGITDEYLTGVLRIAVPTFTLILTDLSALASSTICRSNLVNTANYCVY